MSTAKPIHIWEVNYQEELFDVAKDGKVVNPHHGNAGREYVIAEAESQALTFVRDRHTSKGVRVIRLGAVRAFANLHLIPFADVPVVKSQPAEKPTELEKTIENKSVENNEPDPAKDSPATNGEGEDGAAG